MFIQSYVSCAALKFLNFIRIMRSGALKCKLFAMISHVATLFYIEHINFARYNKHNKSKK